MKQFNGFEDAQKSARYTGGAKLPKGAYVAKIMNVRYEKGENGASSRIIVQFDIAEGEYKDFFKKAYDADTSEDKKWKGKATIYEPTDDGSDKDKWTKNKFAKWTNAFEDSNKGYSWDWDENKWKGLLIGLNYRTTKKMIDGRPCSYTEVAYPLEVETVRSGKVPEAKDYIADNYKEDASASNTASSSSDDFMNVPAGVDAEIPF
jgi:hypothetical protein